MNADNLLEQYGRIADAPDAIVRLRRLILELAVRGKLVPQDPTEALAEEGLERIATDRARVSQADLPHGWGRASLGALVEFKYGKGMRKSERADKGPVPVFGSNGLVGFTDKSLTPRPSIIVGRKGSAGALNLCVGPSWTTDVAYYVESPSFLDIRFLLLALRAMDLDKLARGVKPGLSRTAAYKKLMRVPPAAEQRRIVTKVDELMTLCDQIEVSRAMREATRDRLAVASFARLGEPDPTLFTTNAHFVIGNLGILVVRPKHVAILRQAILNLGVRGKLVRQEPNDEPAVELKKRAQNSKQRIVIERGIRGTSRPEFSTSAAEPVSPTHWSWAYINDIASVQGGKRLPAGATYTTEPRDPVYISVTDMKEGTISTSNLKHISRSVQRLISKYTINADDLYVTIAGTIGAVGKVPDILDGQNLTENAAKIVFRDIDRNFLFLVLNADDVQDQFREKTRQMAQPKLALKRIAGARIPIPPLPEQCRIVAKVVELMSLCDRLERQLTEATQLTRRLLAALVSEATGVA
ncbi:MAG: restriction endonuclease subunit S [Gemmatimonadota bacterium]|nr:restriction endonuclease subunit S [Gemmatimonadota bacterium]